MIDLTDAWAVPNEYTYRDMTKPKQRECMGKCDVASLGTQSGGFGVFTEQFRVLTLNGRNQIESEMRHTAKQLGLDYESILNGCPTLFKLLK